MPDVWEVVGVIDRSSAGLFDGQRDAILVDNGDDEYLVARPRNAEDGDDE